MQRTDRASARKFSGSEKYSGKIRGCAVGSLPSSDIHLSGCAHRR